MGESGTYGTRLDATPLGRTRGLCDEIHGKPRILSRKQCKEHD
jgi:hypothetical protein